MDIGCNLGATTAEAAKHGAKFAIGIDKEMISITWNFKKRFNNIDFLCLDINNSAGNILSYREYNVVLLNSVYSYLEPAIVEQLIENKDVIFEQQFDSQAMPSLKHKWQFIETVPYSVAAPGLTRKIYVGMPK